MKPLNPIMALLAAAFIAAVARPAGATEILAQSIRDGDKTVADGTSGRILDYALDPKLKFAGDDVRGDAGQKKLAADIVSQWVNKQPMQAAYLFYVLDAGDKNPPSWVNPELAKSLAGETRDLKSCLNDKLTKGPQSQVGKIRASALGDSMGPFLDAAGKAAPDVVINCKAAPQKLAEKEIKDNQNGASAPAVPGGGLANAGNGQPDPLATNKTYGMNDLYVQGAQTAYVYRDAQDGYRLLSMKMYSVPQSNGTVKTELGIVDITGYDPNHNPPRIPAVFSPTYVSLPLAGKTTVTVYGVKPDGSTVTRNYDLLANYEQITLSRPGSAPGAPGSTTFTAADLLQKRAMQAASQGMTTIGSKSYYVLGQGGTSGTFLFFDPSNMSSGRPAFVSGDVNIVDASGNWVRNTSNPNLNPVGADPSELWHLEWIGGHWTVVAGSALPATSSTTAPGGAPATPATPATTPATTSATNPASNAGGTPCAGGNCTTYNDAYTQRDANADFSDASKQRVFLMRDKVKTTDYYIQFAQNEVKGGTKMLTFNATQVPGLVGIRGYEDAFALEIKKDGKFEVQYLPIDKVVANFNTGAAITPFDDFDTDTIKSASNFPVVLDMLTYYYSGAFKNTKGAVVPKATALATITARANKRIAALGGKTYTVGGAIGVPNTPLFIASNTNWEIWPGDKAIGGGGARPGDANLVGPGAVGDIATATDAPMPATGLDIGGGVTLTRKDKQQGPDIGLYQADGTQDWYMFLRVARDGGTARTGAIKLGGPIAQWMKNPAAVNLQGIASINPPLPINAPPLQFIGTPSKGAYVVYRNVVPASDGSNVKDKKANCAGAVIWYGVDAATAQQACANGHF